MTIGVCMAEAFMYTLKVAGITICFAIVVLPGKQILTITKTLDTGCNEKPKHSQITS